MVKRKDPEITSYKLKNGKTYYRLKTYIGTNPSTGKPVKVTRSKLKSRKEADQLRTKLKAEGPEAVINKLHINQNRKTVTDVYNVWLGVVKLDVRGSTVNRFKDTWKNHTSPNFGQDYIDSLSPDKIQKYVDDLATKYITYKTIANQLHRLIKYAIFRHWCNSDPFDFVIMPKKSVKEKRDTSHNFYERDELKRFLEVAKEYNFSKYTYFLTVASLGCRRGEGLALQWNDINFKNKTVKIERTVSKDENGHKTIDNVKNGVKHTVPMSNNLYTILKEYQTYVKNKGDDSKWLFHQSDGTYWWSQQIDIWIKWIYKFDQKQVTDWNAKHPDSPKTPLRHITPHGLRHTLATLLYEGNENIRPKDVQYLLGHKSVKTALEIYTHVTEKQKEDIKDSINKLDF